jgi:hypothetical protein
MIFKIRPDLKKQFDTVYNFNFENLVVSGCSFTYNNSDTSAVTWPYYLRDLGGFQTVFDCSMPGAGNSHISDSLIWGLELEPMEPEKTLIIVMWSSADRDDYIAPKKNINNYPFQFHYSQNVMSAITGGIQPNSPVNTIHGLKELSDTKNNESRAIENYLYITKTYQYLKALNYKFVFLDFLQGNIPSRSNHFDIKKYLPNIAKEQVDSMMSNPVNLYEYAVKTDLLCVDDFHPNPDGHLEWTKKILIPHLKTVFG